MTPATTPAEFVTVTVVVVVLLLVATMTGRFILRCIAVTLMLVAGAAVVVLDGGSPL